MNRTDYSVQDLIGMEIALHIAIAILQDEEEGLLVMEPLPC